MPRFEMRCSGLTADRRDAAAHVLVSRFPEVEVIAERHEDTAHVWVCVAPSETHLRRWASAARLRIRSISPATGSDQSVAGTATDPTTDPRRSP